MKLSTIAELEPLRHVVLDMCKVDRGLHAQLERFYTEIELRCRTRGWETYLLIDLPDLGKAIDKGISSGFFDITKIPKSFGTFIYDDKFESSWIFRSLISILFDSFGQFDGTSDPFDVFCVRQLCYLYKKYKIDCTEERTMTSVNDFFDIESELYEPSGSWDHDQYLHHRFTFRGSKTIRPHSAAVRSLMYTLDSVCSRCVPKDFVDVFNIKPRHGPGAVADARSGTDKYLFHHWPVKLDRIFPADYFTTVNEELASEMHKEISQKEPPAKLLAVPKTYKGPRLIASEPTAHQFLQQGLLSWLRSAITRTPLQQCIDFLDQGPSRDAALSGSLTGDYSSVDLSSASDRLSCWTVERAFGSNQSLLEALHACRTRTVVDGTGLSDRGCKLKKFAAQGSAVTFPVQSIVYACMAITATIHALGLSPSKSNIDLVARKVRVFGDDIILPSPAVPHLVSILEYNQLKVNLGKTHTHGFFRESCGMDAYKGTDVTPGYIRSHTPGTSADSLSSWVEVSNNFHSKGLWVTSHWMLDQIPDKIRNKIIVSNRDGTGIRLRTFSSGTAVRQSRERFSTSLHRREALVLSTRSRTRKRSRGSYDDLLDYFLQAPSPETYWSHGYITRTSLTFVREWVALE